jgi:hypothetical protein
MSARAFGHSLPRNLVVTHPLHTSADLGAPFPSLCMIFGHHMCGHLSLLYLCVVHSLSAIWNEATPAPPGLPLLAPHGPLSALVILSTTAPAVISKPAANHASPPLETS